MDDYGDRSKAGNDRTGDLNCMAQENLFGRILQDAIREGDQDRMLQDRWNARVPFVVVKTPSLAKNHPPQYRLMRLGQIRTFEQESTGPRGGTRPTQHMIDSGLGAWNYKRVDVRLADAVLLAEHDRLTEEIRRLEEARKSLLRDRFLELDLLEWRGIDVMNAPFRDVMSALRDARRREEGAIERFNAALAKAFPDPIATTLPPS